MQSLTGLSPTLRGPNHLLAKKINSLQLFLFHRSESPATVQIKGEMDRGEKVVAKDPKKKGTK